MRVVTVICFECSFHTLQHVRELPEFAYLMSIDRSRWPRCLLWHGWLPGLKGGLVNLGVETVVFPRVVRLVWCLLWPYMSPGVVILILCLMLSLNFLLIILSAVLNVLVPCLSLLGSLLSMSDLLVRMCPLVSVLLSTSKSVRKAMKLWDISGDGGFWKVQLDVRDLGGHLDFTFRARAGTLSNKIGKATVGVASVGAFTSGFSGQIGAGSW